MSSSPSAVNNHVIVLTGNHGHRNAVGNTCKLTSSQPNKRGEWTQRKREIVKRSSGPESRAARTWARCTLSDSSRLRPGLESGDSVAVRGELGVLEHLPGCASASSRCPSDMPLHTYRFRTNMSGGGQLNGRCPRVTSAARRASVSSRWRSGNSTVSRPIALCHACHSLGNSWTGVLESFSDARTHGDNALFLQFEDGAQIHLWYRWESVIYLSAFTATVLR